MIKIYYNMLIYGLNLRIHGHSLKVYSSISEEESKKYFCNNYQKLWQLKYYKLNSTDQEFGLNSIVDDVLSVVSS